MPAAAIVLDVAVLLAVGFLLLVFAVTALPARARRTRPWPRCGHRGCGHPSLFRWTRDPRDRLCFDHHARQAWSRALAQATADGDRPAADLFLELLNDASLRIVRRRLRRAGGPGVAAPRGFMSGS